MKQALASMQHRGVRAAWNAWLELATIAAANKRRLVSAGKAFAGDVSRKAWVTWLDMVTLERDHVHQREVLRLAVRRMVLQSEGRAFESWRAFAHAAAASQAKVRSCLLALSPKGQAKRKAFISWKAAAASVGVMQRAASSLINRGLRGGWNGWIEYATEEAQRRAAMSKAITAMTQRQERAALNTWITFAEAASEHRRLLLSAAAAFKGDGMRKAFMKWMTAAREQLHAHSLALRLAGRLTQAPLARAISTWKSSAEDRLLAMKLIAKSAAHLTTGVGRAWTQWRSLMKSWYRLKRFARRLLRREVVRAWAQWQDWAERQRKLRRLIKRGLESDLYRALLKWNDSMLNTGKLRRFASRLFHRGLSKTFDTWAAHVEAIKRANRRMRPIARRMLLRQLGASLNKWLGMAAEGRRQRAIGRPLTPCP